MSALLAHRLARQPALPDRSAPPVKSPGAAAGTPLFLQRAVSDDRPGSPALETKGAVPALQRQASEDEETVMGETAAAVAEAPAAAEPAAETSETTTGPEPEAKGDICCDPEELTPPQGFSFDINEVILLPTVCTPSGCVRITIDSKWASPHAAKHFRVKMILFTGAGTGRVIQRRFDVGHETQTFKGLGRCNSFKLQIEVFSPDTSPNLIGQVGITGC